MTEQEAKSRAIKETDYCYVLACAWSGVPNDSICLERIYVKDGGEEIRLAWWKDGNQVNGPAGLDTPRVDSAIHQRVEERSIHCRRTTGYVEGSDAMTSAIAC